MISCHPFPTILNIKPIPDDKEQKLQAITGWIELSGKLSETPPTLANSRWFLDVQLDCSGPLWWMTSSANWRLCRSSAVGVFLSFDEGLVESSLTKWRNQHGKRDSRSTLLISNVYYEYVLECIGKRSFLQIQTLLVLLGGKSHPPKDTDARSLDPSIGWSGGTHRAWRVYRSAGHRVGLPKIVGIRWVHSHGDSPESESTY